MHDDQSITDLKKKKGEKDEKAFGPRDSDHPHGGDSLNCTDKPVENRHLEVGISQAVEELIEMAAMGHEDVLSGKKAPKKGEKGVVDKVKQ